MLYIYTKISPFSDLLNRLDHAVLLSFSQSYNIVLVIYIRNLYRIIHETSSETHNQVEGLKLCVLEDVW